MNKPDQEQQEAHAVTIPVEWYMPDSIQSRYTSPGWQTIVNNPRVRQGLRRLAAEALRQAAAGETEEGGFAVE